jgi:hypothetical protein
VAIEDGAIGAPGIAARGLRQCIYALHAERPARERDPVELLDHATDVVEVDEFDERDARAAAIACSREQT